MRDDLKQLFHYYLINYDADVKLKVQVLRNIENFLREEESKMMKSYDECKWFEEAFFTFFVM